MNLEQWRANALTASTYSEAMADKLYTGLQDTSFAKKAPHHTGSPMLDQMLSIALMDVGMLRKWDAEAAEAAVAQRKAGADVPNADRITQNLINWSQKSEVDFIRLVGRQMLQIMGETKTIWIYNLLSAAELIQPRKNIVYEYRSSPNRRKIQTAMKPLLKKS